MIEHNRALLPAVRPPLVVAAVLMALALLVPATVSARYDPAGPPLQVQLLAINDFHGNLQPPSGSSGRIGSLTGTDCLAPTCYLAGGVEYLATHIRNLHATNPHHTLEVAAGDLIGATPLLSAAFHDEPTIQAMNKLGLDVSAVGNHEFDEGVAELLRMQRGGCHPVDGCQDGTGFRGAQFQFLAANVVRKSNGKPILPAFTTRWVGGVKIGFIGLTLEGTPDIVTASGIRKVNFLDEATTINAATAALRARGVHTIVVLLHEGGAQTESLSPSTINTCTGISGPIVDIVNNVDPDVDLVISGHTHNAYNCVINNIPVTSSSSFGRLVTDIDMTISRATHQPIAISVNNRIVTRDVAPDARQTTLIARYNTAIAPVANRVVGSITADIVRTASAAGESALGDVIADAQLWDTAGESAEIAFMNSGGIRADLTYSQISGGEAAGEVTYGEAFAVQPFNNYVVTQTLTGAQIKTVLEQQFCNAAMTTPRTPPVILQPSVGFTYSWDSTLACGAKVSSMMLNSTAINLAGTYRVTMNNFLADGGDGFVEFKNGTSRVYGGLDIDSFADYLTTFAPVAPGPQNRITKLG